MRLARAARQLSSGTRAALINVTTFHPNICFRFFLLFFSAAPWRSSAAARIGNMNATTFHSMVIFRFPLRFSPPTQPRQSCLHAAVNEPQSNTFSALPLYAFLSTLPHSSFSLTAALSVSYTFDDDSWRFVDLRYLFTAR